MPASYESKVIIQKAYIAYYGRAADPAGLEFWAGRLDQANGNLSDIIENFGNSTEFEDNFSHLSEEDLINNLYQQLFNRDAEAEGLEFYTGILANGQKTLASIALDILNGAQNTDASIIENKLDWVEDFSLRVKLQSKAFDDVALDSVKATLRTIEGDEESLNGALADIDDLVESMELDTDLSDEDDDEADIDLEVAQSADITVDDSASRKILLGNTSEIIQVSDTQANVHLHNFGEGDRLLISADVLDDSDLTPFIQGTELGIAELLVEGGANADAVQDIEAFLTGDHQNQISVEIERETDDLYKIELKINFGQGQVKLHDMLIDAATLVRLGFDLEVIGDSLEFDIKSDINNPEAIVVNIESEDDESEDDESEDDESEDDESEDDESEDDESEDDDSEDDESEDDESEDDDSEDDESEDDESEDDESEDDESEDDESEDDESEDDESEDDESEDDESEDDESEDDESEDDESEDDESEDDESEDDESEDDESEDDESEDDESEDEESEDDESEDDESEDDESEDDESEDDESENDESEDDESEDDESEDDESVEVEDEAEAEAEAEAEVEDETDDSLFEDENDEIDFGDTYSDVGGDVIVDTYSDIDDGLAITLVGYLSSIDVFGFE